MNDLMLVERDSLNQIASAIKDNWSDASSELLFPDDFVEAIESMSSGSGSEPSTATVNLEIAFGGTTVGSSIAYLNYYQTDLPPSDPRAYTIQNYYVREDEIISFNNVTSPGFLIFQLDDYGYNEIMVDGDIYYLGTPFEPSSSNNGSQATGNGNYPTEIFSIFGDGDITIYSYY